MDTNFVNETESRRELRKVLRKHPGEAGIVLQALRDGQVNGSTYSNDRSCSCLLGTIARAENRKVSDAEMNSMTTCEIEHLFYQIYPGDTPQNNKYAALAAQWIEEWMSEQAIPAPEWPVALPQLTESTEGTTGH